MSQECLALGCEKGLLDMHSIKGSFEGEEGRTNRPNPRDIYGEAGQGLYASSHVQFVLYKIGILLHYVRSPRLGTV